MDGDRENKSSSCPIRFVHLSSLIQEIFGDTQRGYSKFCNQQPGYANPLVRLPSATRDGNHMSVKPHSGRIHHFVPVYNSTYRSGGTYVYRFELSLFISLPA